MCEKVRQSKLTGARWIRAEKRVDPNTCGAKQVAGEGIVGTGGFQGLER